MEDVQNSFARSAAYGDPGISARVPNLQAQLAEFRREYCRELVREGRLDWLGFDLEADLAGNGSAGDRYRVGDVEPVGEDRGSRTRRWGVRRRR